MQTRATFQFPGWFILFIALAFSAVGQAADLPEGFDHRQHMTVDQVQPGMIGFGKTVYHGTRVETFDVEVVSVETGFAPGKQVVWVRCTDEWMQKLGPVSGMSGSPIFLWPRGTDPRRADPKDARLLGAFAFGFNLGKDCYAGIQPIQQMLEVATRGMPEPGEAVASSKRTGQGKLLAAVANASKIGGWTKLQTTRLDAILKATKFHFTQTPKPPVSDMLARNELSIPLMVGGSQGAVMLKPYLQPLGVTPMASRSGNGAAGLPPKWINPDSVQPERGGVLSIPIVSGDADMAAVGTITEVLHDEDGNITKILGFGHAFMSEGSTNVPLATGYIHFVQPNLSSSFKLGGTLKVVGAIYNDEFAAVTGSTAVKHHFRPATVSVEWPNTTKNHQYHYQLIDHHYYTPLVAAYVAAMSISADTEIPPNHTMMLESDIKFVGEDQPLNIRTTIPGASPYAVMGEIVPYVSALMDNPFGEMQLEKIDTRVRIVDEMKMEEMTGGTVKQTMLAPGDSVKIAVELTPFRAEARMQTFSIDLPEDLPEGKYAVVIGGADAYMQALMETRPHLTNITSQRQLYDWIKYLTTIKTQAMYMMVVSTDQQQVAVGRTEMPDLPSSRAVMLAQPTSTQATPYLKSFDKIVPMDNVIVGQYSFPIEVRRNPEVSR